MATIANVGHEVLAVGLRDLAGLAGLRHEYSQRVRPRTGARTGAGWILNTNRCPGGLEVFLSRFERKAYILSGLFKG